MAFDYYSTPSSTALYSKAYFSSLTFEQASDVVFPTIGPSHFILTWSFSSDELSSGAATLVLPFETIPPLVSIQPILKAMEDAYAEGMHSVKVTHPSASGTDVQFYHFSKIQLFKLINNHANHVRAAKDILQYLENSQLRLPPGYLTAFKAMPICSPMQGLFTSCFPLYKLRDLLDENWLEEDLVNGLAELRYFDYHVSTNNTSVPPSFLFLPTYFFTEAQRLYSAQPQLYSTQILELRKRVVDTHVTKLAFIVHQNNHYSAYVQQLPLRYLLLGDSLHLPALADVVEILKWVFDGLGEAYPTPLHITSGPIAYQGSGDGGEGSCALAALNFIEKYINPGVRPWMGPEAKLFRDSALRELITYHILAFRTSGDMSDWTRRCISITIVPNTDPDFSGYRDFNMLAPMPRHPIYELKDLLSAQLAEHYATLPEARPSVPLVGHLTTEILSKKSVDAALLPPFRLRTPPPKPKGTIQTSKKLRSPSFEIILPQRRCPIKRQKSDDSSIFQSPMSVSDDVDIKPNPQNGKTKATRWDTLDLTKEETKPVSVFFDQGKPPKQPPPTTPTQSLRRSKKKPTASIINLVTPESKPLGNLSRPKEVIKKEVDGKPANPHSKSHSKDAIHRSTRTPPSRSIEAISAVPDPAANYPTLDEAVMAVTEKERALGHIWRRGQSDRDRYGQTKKLTLRCNHYQKAKAVHDVSLDPNQHRSGKSRRTGCMAHVNINRVPGQTAYYISTAVFQHNHDPQLKDGCSAQEWPTQHQRDVVSKLATSTMPKISRSQIGVILGSDVQNSHILEPRQISNIMNQARREAKQAVEDAGGSFNAIVESLVNKDAEDPGWKYRIKLDEHGVATIIWWQSPQQYQLTKRYSDVLINDNTYNRNDAGFALNIGVIIDNFGKSRNIWYALQAREDASAHSWIFRCHLDSAGLPPDTLISDRAPALISSAARDLPLTDHIYCIFHPDENITKRLRAALGSEWPHFQRDFWAAYRAVSPNEFERLWDCLVTRYPAASSYLNNEIYPCRERWAWCWVSTKFTVGVRTNGRLEVENRVNKGFTGPKVSIFQAFNALNERTAGQSVEDMIRVRDTSRHQHPGMIENVFTGPLKILREYVGPFALNTSYREMVSSLYYQTKLIHLPEGMQNWDEYANVVGTEMGFEWQDGEDIRMINDFTNDSAYISTRWLLHQINGRGLRVRQLFQITHIGTGSTHCLALLDDQNYICDCCMGTNLGIPCRHYFQALSAVNGLKFHLGIIRQRWYQDPKTDPRTIPVVGCEHTQPSCQDLASLTTSQGMPTIRSNPLEIQNLLKNPPTMTVPARDVIHTAEAALRPLMHGIQTQEQLDKLVKSLNNLSNAHREETERERIRDPPVPITKGRPRTQRLTGPTEGRPRGSGARSGGNRCSQCHQIGHNRTTCPELRQRPL